MIKFFKNEKAFSLVEAVIALAIVGIAMVVITKISVSSIKRAKKNEIEDVATQAAVEGMDLLKQPTELKCSGNLPPSPPTPGYIYSLNLASTSVNLDIDMGHQSELMPNASSCGTTGNAAHYLMTSLQSEGYIICQQVRISRPDPTEYKYDFEVIMVWKSINDEYEKRIFTGYRLGEIS